MKLVKSITTKDYQIDLQHLTNGKYLIVYNLYGSEGVSEEIYPFEMATVLFDIKLIQLQDAVPSKYVS